MKFPKLFASARILIHLKHISYELKRANDLSESRLRLEHPEYRKLEPKATTRKLVALEAPTVEELNKAYEDGIEAGLETRIEDV
jgi:hypothetical protein